MTDEQNRPHPVTGAVEADTVSAAMALAVVLACPGVVPMLVAHSTNVQAGKPAVHVASILAGRRGELLRSARGVFAAGYERHEELGILDRMAKEFAFSLRALGLLPFQHYLESELADAKPAKRSRLTAAYMRDFVHFVNRERGETGTDFPIGLDYATEWVAFTRFMSGIPGVSPEICTLFWDVLEELGLDADTQRLVADRIAKYLPEELSEPFIDEWDTRRSRPTEASDPQTD